MPPTRISPSTLDNLSMCPCFQYKEYAGDNPAAAEGVLIHKALETGEDDELSLEQLNSLQMTRELVRAQLAAFLDWDNCPVGKRVELHEQKLSGSFGLRGMLDRGYVNLHNRKALVIDMKMGRLGILREAKDNLQLAAYADLILTRFPGLVDEVRVGLSAPRTREVSIHDYRSEDWDRIKQKIGGVVEAVEDPFKTPRFHDALCGKCNLIARCPAASSVLVPPVQQAVSIVDPAILTKPVSELTREELAASRSLMDLLEKWAEIRKPQIDERVFGENLELPGYTRVQKDGSLFVPADKTEMAWGLVKDLLSPEQFLSACGKPSLSKLVDALADDCLGESLAERKTKAREELFSRLEGVIAQSAGSSYLRRKAKLDLRLLGVGTES